MISPQDAVGTRSPSTSVVGCELRHIPAALVLVAGALMLGAVDRAGAQAPCQAALRVYGPNGQDSATTELVTAVHGQSLRLVATAPGCRLPPRCRVHLVSATVDVNGRLLGRFRVLGSGDAGAETFTTSRRSKISQDRAFRAVIACGRRVVRQSAIVRGQWRSPQEVPQSPPPETPPPAGPPPPGKLRLTLSGRQGSAYEERDLATDQITRMPPSATNPEIKATAGAEAVSGTVSITSPLAPGEALFVFGTSEGRIVPLCNGPGGCTFTAPGVSAGADRFEEMVAAICAPVLRPASTGCDDARRVEVDIDWDPV